MRMGRLAELLGLTVDETERELATLVSEGALFAKVIPQRNTMAARMKPRVRVKLTFEGAFESEDAPI